MAGPTAGKPRGKERSGLRGSFVLLLGSAGEADYPFARQVAAQLPGHDDREQFLAGIDLILTGIMTVR
jgi:hypothetical protein